MSVYKEDITLCFKKNLSSCDMPKVTIILNSYYKCDMGRTVHNIFKIHNNVCGTDIIPGYFVEMWEIFENILWNNVNPT